MSRSKKKTPVPKYIGTGSFGCTFSPPIPCKSNIQAKQKLIGKVFYDSTEMIDEIERYKKIMKIDPGGKLFPRMFPYSTCMVNESEHKAQLEKCKEKKFESTTRFQIFQEYAGKDLEKFIETQTRVSVPKDPNVFVRKFKDLGDRLATFNKSYFHNDIKSDNIVIDDRYNLKLIDPSLVDKLPRVKKYDENIDIEKLIKRYLPFDLYFATKTQNEKILGLYNQKHSVDSYLDSYTSQIFSRTKSKYKNLYSAAKKDIVEWHKGDLKIQNHELSDSYSLGILFIKFMHSLYPSWTATNIMKLYQIVNPNPLKRRHIADVLGKLLLSSKR